jgi:hypothetical protein
MKKGINNQLFSLLLAPFFIKIYENKLIGRVIIERVVIAGKAREGGEKRRVNDTVVLVN